MWQKPCSLLQKDDSMGAHKMKLSVVVPARNEEDLIREVLLEIDATLTQENISHEIIVVDDNSTDKTGAVIDDLAKKNKNIIALHRQLPNGFGRAIRDGIERSTGDVVVTAMGDASDDAHDIVLYFRKIEEGYDCVFGSRFIKGSCVKDYPMHKLFINRIANMFLKCLFLTSHNDLTNAFKAYKREVLEAIKPIESLYFNITIELPLKALIREYSIAAMPIRWYGRKSGVSKLKIKDMGRRYLYTALYIWLQRILIRDDVKDRGR